MSWKVVPGTKRGEVYMDMAKVMMMEDVTMFLQKMYFVYRECAFLVSGLRAWEMRLIQFVE